MMCECEQGSDDAGMSVPSIPSSLQPYHDLVKDTDQLLNICKRRSLLVNAGKVSGVIHKVMNI